MTQLLKHISLLWHTTSKNIRIKIVILLLFLFVINCSIWIIGISTSHIHPLLLGLITLAYGLGLRHAVDADHIAAIDNTTRKLMSDGKKPVAVGLFFSLGHSTIVFILTIFVAYFTVAMKHILPTLQSSGMIIGTTISSFFLILIGFINLIAFLDILRVFTCVSKGKSIKNKDLYTDYTNGGFLVKLFRPILKSVTKSWHMYFVGFMFGLGFDTASEVGLLGISAASSHIGISFGEILLLPCAFTAGMSLIDTLDGILMLGAYGWAYVQPVRKLYYNLNITLVSFIIALFIGGVEAVQLLSQEFKLNGLVFQAINTINFEKLGYITICIFIVSWLISIAFYKIHQYDSIEVR